MPTQSRGFFACDYCGLQHDTLEEATEHELSQCPRAAARRPIGHMPAHAQQQQQGLLRQSPNYFLQQQHHRFGVTGMGPLVPGSTEGTESYPHSYARAAPYAGYGRGMSQAVGTTVGTELPYPPKPVARGGSISSPIPTRCIPLANYPPDRATDILTMIDTMACQSVEVFEATTGIIEEYERISGSSDSRIVPKRVGLRCRNCGSGSNVNSSKPNFAEAGAIAFPDDLLSVGSGVRQIADRHLTSCPLTNPDVQAACQRAASKRYQRERGMVGLAESNTNNDDGDDHVSKTSLVEYCAGFCQQMGIVNKRNHKSGLEFSSTTGAIGDLSTHQHRMVGSLGETTIAPTPLQRRRDGTSTTAMDGAYSSPFAAAQVNRPIGVGGAYGSASAQLNSGVGGVGSGSSYPVSHSGQQSYADSPVGFPFYQEVDRTWHCRYCNYMPHEYRASQSIWSSSGGGPPPASFIDQHLSVCRAYRQQNFSAMPPGGGMLSTGQAPFGMVSYGNPSPSPYGMPLHGQQPNPSGPWETATPLGGTLQSSHMQYSQLMAHQDPNYRYGQPPSLPPGIVNPHTMDTSMGGARFLSSLGQMDGRSGYPDRGGPIMPALPPTGSRGPSYALGSGNSATDLMKEAMTFLANYEVEYYACDPESAAIPKLVLDEDHLLLTDYFFYLMKQLRLVRFTENDRKTRGGKREKIKIGYGGLQCIHCADLPMSRKFFWSNVDRLANSFAEIPGHVLKCRRCPQANKDALMRLKQGHPEQMSKLPRGSQKIFFRRMWRRLHEGDPQEDDVVVESPKAQGASENSRPPVSSIQTSPEKDSKSLDEFSQGSVTVTSDETILVMHRSAKEAANALVQSALNKSGPPSPSSRILVAIPEDKEWLSDIDSYVRKQLEVFCATEEDVAAAQEDRKYPITVGQVGIRCIHCSIVQGNDAIGHAIAYPFSISGIYESVKEFHRLHLDSCPNLPATSKAKFDSMKGASSLSSVLRKYYTLAAKALGLVDTKDGIRTGGQSTPIGSLAAFTFSETDDGSPNKSKDRNDDDRKASGARSLVGIKQDKNNDEGSEETDPSRISGKKRSGSPSEAAALKSKQKYAKREL